VKTEGRLRIKLLVSLHPGLHLRELQRQIGLSFSSTRYHLDKLAKQGEIDRVEDNGYSRIYPAGIDQSDKILLKPVTSQEMSIAVDARDTKLDSRRELTKSNLFTRRLFEDRNHTDGSFSNLTGAEQALIRNRGRRFDIAHSAR